MEVGWEVSLLSYEEKNMIYTVTLNPSIDYVIEVPCFDEGGLNRSQEEIFLPGGKGINVSIVLKNLGISRNS